MHPLDLIKTRFQLQNNSISSGGSQHYSGVRDCASKMYRQEGILAFWKGIIPVVLVETPKRAWKFFTFEQFKRIFLFGSDKPGALVSNDDNSLYSILSSNSDVPYRPTPWLALVLGPLKPSSSILLRW